MRVLSVIILGLGASQALASDLEAKLGECRALQSDELRLACYDAITVAAPAETPAPAVAPQAAAEPPAVEKAPAAVAVPPPPPEESFGKSAEVIQREQQQSLGQEELTEIASSVAKLRSIGYSRVEIALENGQVWHQTSSSSLRLKVGDDVVIKRGAIGSYRMFKVGSNRSMRVRRQE